MPRRTTIIKRGKGVLRPIVIPRDQLLELKSFLKSSRSENEKHRMIKKICGGVCVICGKIPIWIIAYDENGITLIERYCDKCVKSSHGLDDQRY